MKRHITVAFGVLMVSLGMYTMPSVNNKHSCCPIGQLPCNTLNVTKDDSLSNKTHYLLLCETCSSDEDALTYWLFNGTFPDRISGMDEGSSIQTNFNDSSVLTYRELNITDGTYVGNNFTCVLLGSGGTRNATITL